MVIIETLFDVISATTGAILGAVFAFYLNRKRTRKMISQQGVCRHALQQIKEENERLLSQIKEKENLILQMQIQLLDGAANKKKRGRPRKIKTA